MRERRLQGQCDRVAKMMGSRCFWDMPVLGGMSMSLVILCSRIRKNASAQRCPCARYLAMSVSGMRPPTPRCVLCVSNMTMSM